MVILGLLAIADVAVAARVGAAMRDDGTVLSAFAAPVTTGTTGAPSSTTSTTRPPTTTTTAAALAPAPPAHVTAAVARTSAPSGCTAIVAAIAWPPGWHVDCTGPRNGLLGLTNPNGTTSLYVRSGESDSYLRVVALHEAGHAWDFARLDSNKISQWCAARGCDAARFFSGGASGPGWSEPGGAEDWAAVWDECHGGSYHRSYTGLGAPTPSQCALQRTLVGAP